MRWSVIASLLATLLIFSSAKAREWSDASGKFRIEAEFVRIHQGKVELRKKDGSKVAIPLAKLSKSDQEFLKSKGDSKDTEPVPPRFDPAKIVKLKIKPGQDPEEPGEVRSFTNGVLGALSFAPTGHVLAVGEYRRGMNLYDLNEEQLISVEGTEREDVVGRQHCAAFTYDGKRLLVAGDEGLVVYDLSGPKMLRPMYKFDKHDESSGVFSIAISADNKIAATGGEKDLRVWKIESGEELFAFEEFTGEVKACFLSADGTMVYGTDGDHLVAIRIADATLLGRVQLTELGFGSSILRGAAFSPDGKWVACSDGKVIRWWDLKTGKEQPAIPQGEIVGRLQFTWDSTRLVASPFGGVHVWDLKSQKELLAAKTPGEGVVALAISPDNEHVAYHGGIGAVHVLRIPKSGR